MDISTKTDNKYREDDEVDGNDDDDDSSDDIINSSSTTSTTTNHNDNNNNNNNNIEQKQYKRMRRYCSLLARLHMNDEARRFYCDYICSNTVAQITHTVERELHKMDDPAMAAMSHLGLVSQCLDTIVATYESEGGFVHDQFGNTGLLYLLRELHRRCTSTCVPVLQDFMSKRKEVLLLNSL